MSGLGRQAVNPNPANQASSARKEKRKHDAWRREGRDLGDRKDSNHGVNLAIAGTGSPLCGCHQKSLKMKPIRNWAAVAMDQYKAFSLNLSPELDARPRTYADLAFWQARCANAGEQVEASLLMALSDEYLLELQLATRVDRLRNVLYGELARRRACWFGGHGRLRRRFQRLLDRCAVRSDGAHLPTNIGPYDPVAMRTEMAGTIGRKSQGEH